MRSETLAENYRYHSVCFALNFSQSITAASVIIELSGAQSSLAIIPALYGPGVVVVLLVMFWRRLSSLAADSRPIRSYLTSLHCCCCHIYIYIYMAAINCCKAKIKT